MTNAMPSFAHVPPPWVPIRAVLCGALETGGVIVSMSVKAEYDGTVRFDMALTPYLGNMKGSAMTASLEQLWVDIPLRAECATLFTYWPLAGGELKVNTRSRATR